MPSHLTSVAMLVSFNASQWTAKKIDKAKSAELTEANNAKDKSAYVSKRLIQTDTLTLISQCVTRAREAHKRLTSPWLDNGTRILSAILYDTYMAELEKEETLFWPLVETFLRNYPDYIEQAASEHVALGKLFNRQDYPSLTRLRNLFDWNVKAFPIPDSDDFRAAMPAGVVARIKSDIQTSVTLAANGAVTDVLERANDCVSRMVESLSAFNPTGKGKEKHTFHDTMIGQIRDLVQIMPGLNFTNDARIASLAERMASLCEHDAETLRTSDNIRQGMAAKATEIAQGIADFMA